MDKEEQTTLRTINQQLDALKKSNEYTLSLNDIVKKEGFLTTDEKAYTNVLRENAVKKSNLVTTLSEGNNFQLWSSNATDKAKVSLFNLAHKQSLHITPEEQQALNKIDTPIIPHGFTVSKNEYHINPGYSPEAAQQLMEKTKISLEAVGKNALAAQKTASEVIATAEKDWDSKQALFQLLNKNVGETYDTVWQELKRATKQAEVEQEGQASNHIILNTKFMGREQKIKFDFDSKKKITDLTFIPELTSTIHQIREQANTNKQETTLKNNI